jgi:hypothetical protein
MPPHQGNHCKYNSIIKLKSLHWHGVAVFRIFAENYQEITFLSILGDSCLTTREFDGKKIKSLPKRTNLFFGDGKNDEFF